MTSFKKDSGTVIGTAGNAEVVSVAVPQETAVSATTDSSGFKIGGVSGPVRKSDFKIPTLNLVHNVGELQENFEAGSIVLNKEVALSDGEAPVKLTVLSFKKYFLERVSNDDYTKGKMPRQFHSEEELAKAGLHTNWIGDAPAPAFDAGEALVALESDKEHPHFPLSYGDKFYTLAIWRLNSSSAFSRAGKLILTASQWNLRDGVHNGTWQLTTRREKMGRNFVVVPVLKAGPRNPKELAEFFASLI